MKKPSKDTAYLLTWPNGIRHEVGEVRENGARPPRLVMYSHGRAELVDTLIADGCTFTRLVPAVPRPPRAAPVRAPARPACLTAG